MCLIVGAVLVILGGAACSSPPTAPAPVPQPANVAGNWTGTLASTNFVAQAVAMQLSQAESTVTGTWGIASGATTGTITGTTDTANFVGMFTINSPSSTGVACTGSAAVNGPAGGATIVWTGLGFTGNCNNFPVSLTWRMQRQ